jgi:3-dehydroquinate synthase
MPEIRVNLPREPYSIVIEPGALSQLGARVRAVAPHERCLLVMDHNVVEPHGEVAQQSLQRAGYQVAATTLTADEKHKTLAAAESLYRVMLEARLERRSPVIALGGGIVGDIAGYAAATYLRGVPLIHAPTTLLAMVDASIGGKTGVNFPLPGSNDLGKNLVGAFWQPKLVLADPEVLLTLRRRDFVCGLAECIKHALIADASLLAWLRDNAKDILTLIMPTWQELILRCAAIKAAVVAEDERENGRRALLNLGHTFAHALESASTEFKHGEAVALGLVAAGRVATSLNLLTTDQAQLITDVIHRCELPSTFVANNWSAERAEHFISRSGELPSPERARSVERLRGALENRPAIDQLMRAMTFDKKVADGRMRLVLPRGIGAAEVVDDVPLDLVRDAWSRIGAQP